MIISGYQGIGKSTVAKGDKNFIDLESSSFFVNGQRPIGWYEMYCKVAEHLSQQGYNVFVSSHYVVRDYLKDHCNEKLVVIFPSLEMKAEWVSKLQTRFEQTQSDKDFKALMNAEEMYESSITELMTQEGFQKIIIKDMNYDLREILSLISQGIHTSGQTFIVGN